MRLAMMVIKFIGVDETSDETSNETSNEGN